MDERTHTITMFGAGGSASVAAWPGRLVVVGTAGDGRIHLRRDFEWSEEDGWTQETTYPDGPSDEPSWGVVETTQDEAD